LTTAVDGDAVDFYAAGDHGKGEFRCSECGYGIAVCRELPICPMCSCEVWETASWRPFARAFETTTLR
jgi:ribosomal protein S14